MPKEIIIVSSYRHTPGAGAKIIYVPKRSSLTCFFSPQVGINYFVRVLQQGAWPLSQTGLSPLNVPLELERTVQAYERFYAKQFSGRKLTWLHHLSNGDVRVGYLAKPYIVNMTTFQVMYLFSAFQPMT